MAGFFSFFWKPFFSENVWYHVNLAFSYVMSPIYSVWNFLVPASNAILSLYISCHIIYFATKRGISSASLSSHNRSPMRCILFLSLFCLCRGFSTRMRCWLGIYSWTCMMSGAGWLVVKLDLWWSEMGYFWEPGCLVHQAERWWAILLTILKARQIDLQSYLFWLVQWQFFFVLTKKDLLSDRQFALIAKWTVSFWTRLSSDTGTFPCFFFFSFRTSQILSSLV